MDVAYDKLGLQRPRRRELTGRVVDADFGFEGLHGRRKIGVVLRMGRAVHRRRRRAGRHI